jgi:chromosomal replication initiator protein
MIERNPSAKIRYIHAEAYVSDVVRAYQRKSFDELKTYYHSLDLLLVDDIQFFAGKSRTQEEFFYTFEALVAARKQLIITSDTLSRLNSKCALQSCSGKPIKKTLRWGKMKRFL